MDMKVVTHKPFLLQSFTEGFHLIKRTNLHLIEMSIQKGSYKNNNSNKKKLNGTNSVTSGKPKKERFIICSHDEHASGWLLSLSIVAAVCRLWLQKAQ